ncbi:hypothetical protein AB205_0194290, partial [Aquarana catesbeiana]
MSSFSNAIDEWSTRSTSGISALRHHLISSDFPDRLTPVNAMAAIVDSAYSSFSGSSYVADYQTSFKHDMCHLTTEQISYMDSEYVKAIYNPSVIENNPLQQHLHCEDSKQDASSSSGPEDHFSHKTKRSPTSNNSLCLPEHKISRQQGHGHSPPWVRHSVQNKLSQSCALSGNIEENSQLHLPSSTFLATSEDMMALDEEEQYQLLDQNIKDIEFDNLGKCNIKYKRHHTRTSQAVFSVHSDDLCEQPKAHSLKKDATIKPIPLLSQKQEARPQSSNFCDLPSEKITKASTPMLYHLAGGNSSFAMLNTSKQTKLLDTSEEPNSFQKKCHSQMAEPQQPFHKTKSPSQLDENLRNEFTDCETTGDPTCSYEDSFMLDYREKLKIAQKKVLRETSFKRRDLQMSLPVRLKLNPPKRPSVDHIRSYSLSSPIEDAKFTQPNISADKGHKKDESEKATVLRIGGRKRLTKEQRKLCYSEPEKLDHLGIHNSGLAWNSDESVQNKLGDHYRMKSLDKERTLSSSNISKTELKQIQHNALVEYMERRASRRPSNTHQSNLKKTSGTQSSPEWKSITNETSCNEDSLRYHHRRSTGTSSSYDATVTWNDRYLKMSLLGEQTHSADTLGEKTTYFDRCTLDDSKGYSKESSTSGCREGLKSSKNTQQSDEDLPGYDNEVRADVNDLCESSAVREPPFLPAGDHKAVVVHKHRKSTEFQSMSSIQQEELGPNPSNQVIGTQTASPVGYDEDRQSNGSTKQEMDGSMQEKRDSAIQDLNEVTLKPLAEERCSELVKEIVSKDKSLVDVLKPLPVRTSAIGLMKSLFHVDISVLEKCRNRGLKKD